jgi:hypothetical protein
MLFDDPPENLPAKKRLLRGSLGNLDISVHGAVVLVERETGRLMFLVVANQDDRAGKRHILPRKISREPP